MGLERRNILINDLLSLFKKSYEKHGDKAILDNYTLKDGLYIRINKDNSKNFLIIKAKKDKEGNIDYLEENEINEKNMELYEWFKTRDYYSSLLEMNKAIDPKKKIHSNNYMTLFIKKDNLLGSNSLSTKEIMERIEQY